MKYEDYSIWDFIEDDYFVDWVKNPNKQSDQFWKGWLIHNPHKAEVIKVARYILTNIQYAETPQPTDHELIDIFENILLGRKQVEKPNFANKSIPIHLLRYAAILLIAIVSTSVWYLVTNYDPEVKKEARIITKETPRGMKSTIWLNDGTKVILNSETSLKYPEYFPDSVRQVYLIGEAFFEVERDNSRRFIVVSQNIKTEVLGTSFNIRSYPGEPEIKVGVISGKVKVTNNSKSNFSLEHQLFSNQMSIVNLQQKIAHKRTFYPKDATAWKDWILKFKNQSLSEIFKEIEKWYAVDIIVKDNLDLEQSYSGSFENENLRVVLEVLSHNADFNYKLSGKQVTISKSNLK